MLIRRMVHHEIQNDADPALLGLARQPVKILERAVHGIDVFVVRDVIPKVDLRRRAAWRYPDCVYPQLLQVVEPGGDPLQVANTIMITVCKTPRINLVKHGMMPPLMAFRVDGLLRRRGRKKTNEK